MVDVTAPRAAMEVKTVEAVGTAVLVTAEELVAPFRVVKAVQEHRQSAAEEVEVGATLEEQEAQTAAQAEVAQAE